MAKSIKNRGRSRFFSCCRPLINDDTIKRSHAYKSSKDQSLKRVKSQENLDSMLGKDFTKPIRQTRKEQNFGRSFSDALKNVFSETSLGKKSQRKDPNSSSGPRRKLSLKLEKMFSSMNESRSSSKDFSNISRISDDSSLFTSSASCSSSSSSSSSPSSYASSRSISDRKKLTFFHKSKSVNDMQYFDNLREKEIALRYNMNAGIYSLLICLLALSFCGKAFAIVCTSTWFYFAPHCFKRIDSSVKGLQYYSCSSLDIDSEEYVKKNVMVEGLFERNHNRWL